MLTNRIFQPSSLNGPLTCLLSISILIIFGCQRSPKQVVTGEGKGGTKDKYANEKDVESPDSNTVEPVGDISIEISTDEPHLLRQFASSAMELQVVVGNQKFRRDLTNWQVGSRYALSKVAAPNFGSATFDITYKGHRIHSESINHFKIQDKKITTVRITVPELRGKIAGVFRNQVLNNHLAGWQPTQHAGAGEWTVR